NFFSRPELRLFATWMDWSSKLDDFASNDAFGSSGFNTGGEWNFGVQMETWF
ncbi:carbohydrate porin, partial [Escherichia coli]